MSNEFKINLGKDMSKTLMGYYIDTVYKIEKTYFDTEFKKINITYSQFKVLNWLWRYDELAQKEVHDFLQIKPSSLSNLLSILVEKGLVKRYTDPNDARIKKVIITEKAHTLEEQAWDIVHKFDCKIKEILTEEEYKITISSLKKLSKNL